MEEEELRIVKRRLIIVDWTREDQIMWMGEKAKDILERTQEELYIEIWNTETASPTQLIGVMAYIYHKVYIYIIIIYIYSRM